MLTIRSGLFLLVYCILAGCNSPSGDKELFKQILESAREKDFFSAQERLLSEGNRLSEAERHVLNAITANAFNDINSSESSIELLMKDYRDELPDSISRILLDLVQDNASKRYDYKRAKEAVNRIVQNYGKHLSSEKMKDYQNSLKLWTILQDEPPQEVVLSDVDIEMIQDVAGLRNLPIHVAEDTVNFIFDTGANLSTVTRSTALKAGMTILSDSIEVGAITGESVYAQMAVCKEFLLDRIIVRNAVFIVLDDEQLAFPQINYQINGIIGFPVIEALGEIQITKDGWFRVHERAGSDHQEKNLALDQLTPVIRIDGKHYNFDTGADHTMLFKRFFDEHKDEIESTSTLSEINFGGAGGLTTQQGYHIDLPLTINGQKIELSDVPVLTEETRGKWRDIYGNIGQDLIKKFDMMTINFRAMYIRFD